MKKYSISLFLIITLITLGISCRGGRQGTENSDQEISQDLGPQGKRRGQQKRQAVGQGFGKRDQNRNAEKAWGPDDVVELTEEEENAIEIKTVKAAYQPLQSKLSPRLEVETARADRRP
jgi:hypothetical protein